MCEITETLQDIIETYISSESRNSQFSAFDYKVIFSKGTAHIRLSDESQILKRKDIGNKFIFYILLSEKENHQFLNWLRLLHA